MKASAASLLLALLVPLAAQAVPVEMQDAPVRDFARWYSDQVDMDLLIDPSVSGTITVYADDVAQDDLYEFGEGVLRAHGYQILHGNPPLLVPLDDAASTFVDQVDVPQVEQASIVFPINNVRASDVAPLVESYLSRTARAGSGPAVAQVIPSANALLVSGDAERVRDLETFISEFDVPHPQVLINAVIWEQTSGDSLDLGVSLGRASGSDVVGGFNTRNLGTSLSTLGGSFGIFDGATLALAVEALQRQSSARILSTPQILTLSGQSGRISVGQNIPVITGRITGEAADIENPFQTIERKDIGVILSVSPVVTASGRIIMEVTTSADSLTDSMQAADIIFNQRSINTTVSLASGQTLLLGGLDSETDVESLSSVPILGALPGVGALFRSTSTTTEHRKLHVLLQATEVRHHEI